MTIAKVCGHVQQTPPVATHALWEQGYCKLCILSNFAKRRTCHRLVIPLVGVRVSRTFAHGWLYALLEWIMTR